MNSRKSSTYSRLRRNTKGFGNFCATTIEMISPEVVSAVCIFHESLVKFTNQTTRISRASLTAVNERVPRIIFYSQVMPLLAVEDRNIRYKDHYTCHF